MPPFDVRQRSGLVDIAHGQSHLAGLSPDTCRVFEAGSFHLEDGHAACSEVLDAGEGYTAIVAANDMLALGSIDAIRQRGLDVPRDISVTGYDDITLVDRLDPALTTISIPYERMGTEAARLLLDMINGPTTAGSAHQPTLLPPSLIVRSSSGPIVHTGA